MTMLAWTRALAPACRPISVRLPCVHAQSNTRSFPFFQCCLAVLRYCCQHSREFQLQLSSSSSSSSSCLPWSNGCDSKGTLGMVRARGTVGLSWCCSSWCSWSVFPLLVFLLVFSLVVVVNRMADELRREKGRQSVVTSRLERYCSS